MTFEQALRLAGLLPRAMVADGRWRRCATEDHPRKKNGAYVLHPDGRGYWKNWATDLDVNAWRDESATPAKPIDQAKMRARRERERAYRVQAVKSAREFWRDARPLNRPHPYIERKGLTPLGCAGLRTHDGLLVVPVVVDGYLTSVQTIAADGDKKFWPGAPVEAGSYVLDRKHAAVTVFCEGLSTGLAVFQCVRSARVVVCFNAGNLLRVAQRMKPTGTVVFAADNDHGTFIRRGFNPGIEQARNAAESIGAGVAYPQGIEGTDWADALKEWGQGGARRIERQILAGARFVMGVV